MNSAERSQPAIIFLEVEPWEEEFLMKGYSPAWRARFYPEEADRIDLGVIEDEVALSAEQRAAAFYQRLTDMLDDGEARDMARECWQEETKHVEQLEKEMRKLSPGPVRVGGGPRRANASGLSG